MIVIAIALLIGFQFYKLAKKRRLNGIFYGILATIFCYSTFNGLMAGLPLLSNSFSKGGTLLFSAVGALFSCLIVVIAIESNSNNKLNFDTSEEE